MQESNFENFNHLKIHSQFSICEGAIKLDDLKDISKDNKLKAIGLCDTSNLCGALEFAEKLSKSGSQPIIGTQINFKFDDTIGLLPLFALNRDGYKNIIQLSSKSYLENDNITESYLDIKKLLEILHTFVKLGNTVVVIEHNLDVIKTADHIVDMGPEGGVKGGNIVAEGKPEDVCMVKESYTGQFLKKIF